MPQTSEDRVPDDNFGADEDLYHRYSPYDADFDGEPIAANLLEGSHDGSRFPGLSVNRSRYSKPEDVLHPDCCGGLDRSDYGIAFLS